MQGWAKDSVLAVRTLLVLGAMDLACSGKARVEVNGFEEREPPTVEQPPLDPFAPGASVVCSVDPPLGSGGEPQIELYQVSAMNHKLRHYPDFAAEVGIDSVADCAGARQFLARYAEYLQSHPGFDADEPLAPMHPSGPEPEGPSGSLETADEVEKVIAGTNATNHPVVRLRFTSCRKKLRGSGAAGAGGTAGTAGFDDSCPHGVHPDWDDIIGPAVTPPATRNAVPSNCTGTFINKNWILTAAHCVSRAAVDLCVQSGVTRANCKPELGQWGYWTINGTKRGPMGQAVPYTLTNVLARGYIHPNWLGRTNSANPHTCVTTIPAFPCYNTQLGVLHDVALLYIRSQDDDKLPPELEVMGQMDSALRLSNVPPLLPPTLPAGTTAWPLRFYGWASTSTDPNSGESTRVLRVGDDPPPIAHSNPIAPAIPPHLIGTHDETIHSHVCPGDSGGPLVRTVTTPSNTGPRTVEAIVGVLASGNADCVIPQAGQIIRWSRVDLNTDFITAALQNQQPLFSFRCQPRLPVAGGGSELLECWGPPCRAVSECNTPGQPVTRTCWQPGGPSRTRASCDACAAPLGGGCGCIVGQCLPTPTAPP
jgi:hypothetical protein